MNNATKWVCVLLDSIYSHTLRRIHTDLNDLLVRSISSSGHINARMKIIRIIPADSRDEFSRIQAADRVNPRIFKICRITNQNVISKLTRHKWDVILIGSTSYLGLYVWLVLWLVSWHTHTHTQAARKFSCVLSEVCFIPQKTSHTWYV